MFLQQFPIVKLSNLKAYSKEVFVKGPCWQILLNVSAKFRGQHTNPPRGVSTAYSMDTQDLYNATSG